MAKRTRRRRNVIHEVPAGLGPYEFWNFGPGKDYAFPSLQKPSRYLAALAELEPSHTGRHKLPRATGEASTKIWLPTLWKPKLANEKPFEPRYFPFVLGKSVKDAKVADDPVKLRRRLLSGIRQKKIRQYLQSVDIDKSRFRVGLPIAESAMKPERELKLEPTAPDWQRDTGLRKRIGREKRITIFAIIDDGLPFAHRNFRDASGERTRVEFCWLQSAVADPDQTSVLFGREYTRTRIEDMIARHGDNEDALYREAGATADTEGLASLIERHATHGAHVMDLATGYAAERNEQPAEEIRIIAVQLPNVVTMDTSGVGKDMYLLSAFHYIFHRADLIADAYGVDKPRLVINFSYGYSGGPHDGQVDIEAAIGELVKARRDNKGPTALVLPAGNSFLDRMHARITDARFVKGEARLQWRLQPNDRTPNYVELWFPGRFDPVDYTVEVLDPSGETRGSLAVAITRSNGNADLDRVLPLLDREGKPIGLICADHHRRKRWRVLIVTAPSEPEKPHCPGVETGAWTIVIKRRPRASKLHERSIRCWIQRDTDPENLRSGARQSYFDDPDDIRYGCDGALLEEDTERAYVRRFGSLNGLATAPLSIAVAGFRLGAGLHSPLEDAEPARYSCAGTQNTGWPRAKIACSSMSDRSQVLCGTVAAGVRSGARSVMQGTSMAAPFVARQLATTFVSASDQDVSRAERANYLPLLHGLRVRDHQSLRKDRLGEVKARLEELKDRLGEVLVAPHWQPGIED
jgi:hypothetical protein